MMAGTPLRYLTTWERTVPAEFVLLEKRERFPGKYIAASVGSPFLSTF
jgi:hypothetical protein